MIKNPIRLAVVISSKNARMQKNVFIGIQSIQKAASIGRTLNLAESFTELIGIFDFGSVIGEHI